MIEPEQLEAEADLNSGAESSTWEPRHLPYCARCRNHRIKIPPKGYKRYCKYRSCKCDKCRYEL